jgi:hypothetical protein
MLQSKQQIVSDSVLATLEEKPGESVCAWSDGMSMITFRTSSRKSDTSKVVASSAERQGMASRVRSKISWREGTEPMIPLK